MIALSAFHIYENALHADDVALAIQVKSGLAIYITSDISLLPLKPYTIFDKNGIS